MTLASHLIAAPIVLPLIAAAAMLLLGHEQRRLKAGISIVSIVGVLLVSVDLLLTAVGADGPTALGVYLPGNWPVPYGITLVVDRLSALMLVLSSCVGLASLLYALGRWHRAGLYFHVFLQLQLVGLNGAFLTADLFNLFVFFEVLLAASYGLLLHGGGGARVRAGVHYIAINLLASLLFLIGVAVLYGVTGTLNMADIAAKLWQVAPSDLGLLHAGAAILALAFLAKAAIWPLGFWLVPAYSAASAPSAALFTILTKVGIYALLRLWTLCFSEAAGESAYFGGPALVWGGIVTLAFGSVGMLASQHLARIAGFSVIASSGTLVASIGFADASLQAGALYYLVSSTLSGCALFLLVEMLDRARELEARPEADDGSELPMFVDLEPPENANLDDEEETLVGRPIPAALAFLGLAFTVSALVVAGLPPLSGFVGKLTILSALVTADGGAAANWIFFALLIVYGLIAIIAFTRVGIPHFWSPSERAAPRLRVAESLPVGLLLAGLVGLVVFADPVLGYMQQTANSLQMPSRYIEAVMGARPVE